MSDVNPYESPKSLPAASRATSLKRGIGFVTVLFLTPLAVAIAFGISCGAVRIYGDAAYPGFAETNFPLVLVVGFLIFLVPPLLTLIGMAVWARRAYLTSQWNPPQDGTAQEKDPSQS